MYKGNKETVNSSSTFSGIWTQEWSLSLYIDIYIYFPPYICVTNHHKCRDLSHSHLLATVL